MSPGHVVDDATDLDPRDGRYAELRAIRDGLTGWTLADFDRADDFIYGVEFAGGDLELKAMPYFPHPRVAKAILRLLFELIEDTGRGEVLYDGTNLQTLPDHIRKPDIVVTLVENAGREDRRSLHYADLIVEVVSPSDPKRDLVTKRAEYAAAGVPEYWIADPRDGSLTVLVLDGGAYREQAKATTGVVASGTIDGVSVDVDAVIGRFVERD